MADIKIILASKSPRREQLLKKVLKEFKVVGSDFDEWTLPQDDPVKFAVNASAGKAAVVAKHYPAALVIGADTIVVLDGKILGKPKDFKEAEAMLKMLSDKTHQVITGVTITRGGRTLSGNETTSVTFKPLSEKEIKYYVYGSEVLDKAGAYAIQEIGDKFVSEIKGDYDNVVGLPVKMLRDMLRLF